jgi:hypothetical protein
MNTGMTKQNVSDVVLLSVNDGKEQNGKSCSSRRDWSRISMATGAFGAQLTNH